MVVLNEGKKSEVTLRVVLESAVFGREYFDGIDDDAELFETVKRLVKRCGEESARDGIERVVSIAIVPRDTYGDESGYGFALA